MKSKITLDLLVKYLLDNKDFHVESEKNNEYMDKFNLKYLEFYNSKYFHKFSDIFKNHIDRVGIYQNNSKNKNISLLTSILFIIDEDFCTLELKEQEYYIKILNNKIIANTINSKFKIKNMSKKIIIANLKNTKIINDLDIYIYAAFLKINIFIFDFNNNNITLYYPEKELNIYKVNIFISKMNNQYNPLVYQNDNGRIFKYNSSIIENIIYNSNIKVFTLNEKEYVICNNWDILLEKYKNKDLSNIIIDVKEIKDNFLLNKMMVDSDDSSNNLDYDSENSINNNPDFDNLTEELENINNQIQKIDEIDSDNMGLSNDESEEKKFNIEINNINIELLNKVKKMSKSKLLKEKKDILINYMVTLFNKNINDLKKNTKKILVNNLQNELKKSI